MKSRVYFDYLDALRFFAFLAVFIAHAGILFPVSSDWFYWLYRHVISNGAYGVNFFFVLSGFLITFLLLKEKKETHTIDIKFFYLKRVLRIWPVYFTVFFTSIFVLPIIVRSLGAEHVVGTGETFVNLGMVTGHYSFWSFLFFLGNFAQAYQVDAIPFALGVLWSVSVEEQFYLAWPIVVKFCKEKMLVYACFGLFFASLIYKAIHINDANIAYYSTLSVSMDLAFGAVLGIYYHLYQVEVKTLASKIEKKKKQKVDRQGGLFKIIFSQTNITLTILILLCASVWAYNVYYIYKYGYGLVYDIFRLMKRPVLDLLFVLLLSVFVFKGVKTGKTGVKRLETSNPVALEDISLSTDQAACVREIGFKYKPFTYLGRISYGLYAYHTIAVVFVIGVFNHYGTNPNTVSVPIFISIFTLGLALTIFMAHVSYVYMEQKSIALRSIFKPKKPIF